MQSNSTESSIYITVISDSSNTRYPTNTAAHFKVDLAQPLILEGAWQVALTEIHISNNWYDISEDCSIDIDFETNERTSFKSVGSTTKNELDNQFGGSKYESPSSKEYISDEEEQSFTVNIKRNSYPSLAHLCLHLSYEINNQMPSECNDAVHQISNDEKPIIDFQLDALSGNVSIVSIPAVKATIIFRQAEDLLSILSLNLRNYLKYELPIEGNRRASISAGNIGLLVLCNLVQYQNVGNSQMRLLRLVSIKGCDRRDDRHSHYFQKPYYLSCTKNSCQSFEFELRKDNNHPITFPSDSKIIAVLHFQRKFTI